MINLLSVLLFLLNASAFSITQCPYNTNINSHIQGVINNANSNIGNEISVLKSKIDNKNNCLKLITDADQVNASLISELANKITPQIPVMQSLSFNGAELSCPRTQAEFDNILTSYINGIFVSFNDQFPIKEELEVQLIFEGDDGHELNSTIQRCYDKINDKINGLNNEGLSTTNSKVNSVQTSPTSSFSDFRNCVNESVLPNRTKYSNQQGSTLSKRIWTKSCKDIDQVNDDILNLINKNGFKFSTTEAALGATFTNLQATIEKLVNVGTSESCPASAHVFNIANGLISTALSVGQTLGEPVLGLALSLAQEPLNGLMKHLANRKDNKYLKEINKSYNSAKSKKRTNNILCSLISIQKNKCDISYGYESKYCSKPNVNSVPANEKNLKAILNFIDTNVSSKSKISNIEVNDFKKMIFDPIEGLVSLSNQQGSESLSLYDFLFSKSGVLETIEPTKATDPFETKKQKNHLKKLKSNIDLFKSSFDDFITLDEVSDDKVVSLMRTVLNTLIPQKNSENYSSGNSTIDIDLLIHEYHEQVLKSDEQHGFNNLLKFNQNENNMIVNSKIQEVKSIIEGPQLEGINKNFESYFNFMNSEYVADNHLSDIIQGIKTLNQKSIPETHAQRAQFFDINVSSAIRDCLTLYQPILSQPNDRMLYTGKEKQKTSIKKAYLDKCKEILNCTHGLNFTKPEELEPINTGSFDEFSFICKINTSFNQKIINAREKFKVDGNFCESNK